MGGKSKSGTTTNTTTNISDERIAAEGSIIATDGGVINYLSDEVVDSALAFAGKTQEEARELAEKAFELIVNGNKAAFEQIGKNTLSAFEQSQAAMMSQRSEEFQGLSKLMTTGSTVAIVIAMIYFGMRK